MNTTIGKGITVKGTVHAEEPVAIAGTITGDVLVADHEVTIEPGARVEGAVSARVITVHGNSNGRLIARDIVRVEQTASVRADIAAPRLLLKDGATFNGSVEPAKTDAAMRVTAYRNKGEAAAATA